MIALLTVANKVQYDSVFQQKKFRVVAEMLKRLQMIQSSGFDTVGMLSVAVVSLNKPSPYPFGKKKR